jgi:1-deoxy-D-xylulose 5-phosphate reductoisomerase
LYNNFYKFINNDHESLPQKQLTFVKANFKRNPSLKILKFKNILNEVGFILINALNEILVQKFLQNEITFTDITSKLLRILNTNTVKNYLKNHRIRHINDVFKVYNFSRSLVN